MTDEMVFDEEIVTEFKQEALEGLDQAEEALLAVERGEAFLDNYNAIFRTFHSVKGGAGMLRMDDVQRVMHHLEDILSDCKEKGSIEREQVDYFLKGVDATRQLLEGSEVDFELIDPLSASASDTSSAEAEPSEPVQAVELPPSTGLSPNAAAVEACAPRVESVDRSSSGKVFVVDDEPDIVEILEDMLTGAGFVVKGYTSAELLLSELEAEKPDVVLADIAMPGMSGLDLLKVIHQSNPDLPVAFISGEITKDVCMESLIHGVFGFVEKPFTPTQILTMTTNAVRTYTATKLLNQSMNFIMYQFSDLDQFLISQGKEMTRQILKQELENLYVQRRLLRQLRLAS